MTKEYKQRMKELAEFFGEKLANPVHYPHTFRFQEKLLDYHKKRNATSTDVVKSKAK